MPPSIKVTFTLLATVIQKVWAVTYGIRCRNDWFLSCQNGCGYSYRSQ